jgi:molecular chaperone HtpG
VKKITSHISKKVADKLSDLFKQSRTDFQDKWSYIDLFVKYGMLSDEKFAEKVKDVCLLQNTKNEYFTIPEYVEKIKINQTDKDGNMVLLYTHHSEEQHAYISNALSRNYDVVKFEGPLDNHFTGYLEQKNEKLQCKRVDADALDKLIATESSNIALLNEEESKKLVSVFEKVNQNNEIKFKTEALSPEESLLIVTEGEYDRRMREMSKMNGYNMFGSMPMSYQTILNTNHPKAKDLIGMDDEAAGKMASKALNLALLSKGLLKGELLTKYVQTEMNNL